MIASRFLEMTVSVGPRSRMPGRTSPESKPCRTRFRGRFSASCRLSVGLLAAIEVEVDPRGDEVALEGAGRRGDGPQHAAGVAADRTGTLRPVLVQQFNASGFGVVQGVQGFAKGVVV